MTAAATSDPAGHDAKRPKTVLEDVVFMSAPQEHIEALKGRMNQMADGAAATIKIKEEYQEDLEFQQDIAQTSALFIDQKQTEIDGLKAHNERLRRQVEEMGGVLVQ